MLKYKDDLDSDFSAIHRVTDSHTLPAPRFFKWAMRIVHYAGAVSARVLRDIAEESQGGAEVPPDTSRQVGSGRMKAVEVPFSVFQAANPDLVSHSRVKVAS